MASNSITHKLITDALNRGGMIYLPGEAGEPCEYCRRPSDGAITCSGCGAPKSVEARKIDRPSNGIKPIDFQMIEDWLLKESVDLDRQWKLLRQMQAPGG